MKKNFSKIVALVMGATLAMSFVACTATTTEDKTTPAATTPAETKAADATTEASANETTEAPADETTAEEVAVMSYADFVAADVDTQVCVVTYVQDKQGWWENEGVGNASFYTQAEDGAYFLYNMPCTEEEYAKLVAGTKIQVTGYKAEWSGEVEITEATFKILDDATYVAEATDVTDKFGTDDLISYMNQYVAVNGFTVDVSTAADGTEGAFLYNWDGSGSQGDDLYFNLKDAAGNVYSFTVESYLRGSDTDVYKAVEALEVGQTVNVEAFLYWYNGANPHVVSISVQ